MLDYKSSSEVGSGSGSSPKILQPVRPPMDLNSSSTLRKFSRSAVFLRAASSAVTQVEGGTEVYFGRFFGWAGIYGITPT